MQACSLTQSLPLAMVPRAGNTVVKSFPEELEVGNVKTLRGHGISERVTNPMVHQSTYSLQRELCAGVQPEQDAGVPSG